MPISLTDIEQASQDDDCLQVVKQAIRMGDWRPVASPAVHRTEEAPQQLQSLYHVREELTVTEEGCILRGPRLVIPSSLTQRAVKLAHRSHKGMVKQKVVCELKSGSHPSTP